MIDHGGRLHHRLRAPEPVQREARGEGVAGTDDRIRRVDGSATARICTSRSDTRASRSTRWATCRSLVQSKWFSGSGAGVRPSPPTATGHREGAPMDLRNLIRDVPDFPKPGIVFKDITTLTKDPEGLRAAVDAIAERYADAKWTWSSASSRAGSYSGPPSPTDGCGVRPRPEAREAPGRDGQCRVRPRVRHRHARDSPRRDQERASASSSWTTFSRRAAPPTATANSSRTRRRYRRLRVPHRPHVPEGPRETRWIRGIQSDRIRLGVAERARVGRTGSARPISHSPRSSGG